MITTEPVQIIDADKADKKAIERGEFLSATIKQCDLKAINHSRRQFNQMVAGYQNSYRMTCAEIEARETSKTKIKLLKKSALRYTQILFEDNYRQLIDLKGMIKEDLKSRQMRDYYREEDSKPKPKKQKIDVDELLEELDSLLWKEEVKEKVIEVKEEVIEVKEEVIEVKEKCKMNCRNQGYGLCFCVDTKGNYIY